MQFTWKITYISKTITVGKEDKKTEKKVVCLEEVTDGQYPDKLAFDLIGKNLWLADGYNVGDTIKMYYNTSYNRREKDGNESIFNSIRGWKIDFVENGSTSVNKASSEPDDQELPF